MTAGSAPLGEMVLAPGRDPLALLRAQDRDRVPELVPLRYERMAVSPFAYFRGSAAVMAADLAAGPRSELQVQLCGDAHVGNFGIFASPERRLVFDVNDFDETLPGPFEWDVKRLLTSLELVARQADLPAGRRRAIVADAATAYRDAMAVFAAQPFLQVWYARIDVEGELERLRGAMSQRQRRDADAELAKARGRDNLRAVSRLTVVSGGRRRIVADPPLLVPLQDLLPTAEAYAVQDELARVFAGYQRTLQPDRAHLVGQYRVVDVARKVVGVGSVGLRSWVILARGTDDDDWVVLQAKQAVASVLERHLGRSRHRRHGARVVHGQRLVQATSDVFLGWEQVREVDGVRRDYYVRQLQDWKRSVRVDQLSAKGLRRFGRLCAWTLARAHARTGDRSAIAAFLADGTAFVPTVGEFAVGYADLAEADHATLVASRSGMSEQGSARHG